MADSTHNVQASFPVLYSPPPPDSADYTGAKWHYIGRVTLFKHGLRNKQKPDEVKKVHIVKVDLHDGKASVTVDVVGPKDTKVDRKAKIFHTVRIEVIRVLSAVVEGTRITLDSKVLHQLHKQWVDPEPA